MRRQRPPKSPSSLENPLSFSEAHRKGRKLLILLILQILPDNTTHSTITSTSELSKEVHWELSLQLLLLLPSLTSSKLVLGCCFCFCCSSSHSLRLNGHCAPVTTTSASETDWLKDGDCMTSMIAALKKKKEKKKEKETCLWSSDFAS